MQPFTQILYVRYRCQLACRERPSCAVQGTVERRLFLVVGLGGAERFCRALTTTGAPPVEIIIPPGARGYRWRGNSLGRHASSKKISTLGNFPLGLDRGLTLGTAPHGTRCPLDWRRTATVLQYDGTMASSRAAQRRCRCSQGHGGGFEQHVVRIAFVEGRGGA
jgi:hypothetical protein